MRTKEERNVAGKRVKEGHEENAGGGSCSQALEERKIFTGEGSRQNVLVSIVPKSDCEIGIPAEVVCLEVITGITQEGVENEIREGRGKARKGACYKTNHAGDL